MPQPTQSWVPGANEPHGFGLNHLPFGAFTTDYGTHLCVRIGSYALDLDACLRHGLLEHLTTSTRHACSEPTLHALLAEGPESWSALRSTLVEILGDSQGYASLAAERLVLPLAELELVLPIAPRGYTDFYASMHHARRVGELFRPDQPLLPNYRHLPIAYNGRASSIVTSGVEIVRPRGQQRPATAEGPPAFGPSAALDYELELAYVIGQGNELGSTVGIDEASARVFGVALLNDWSARDVQSWEYQPLGPFLGKSFATSVSPWITPMAALEPFRVAPVQHEALAYLQSEGDQKTGALDMALTVSLTTTASRAAGLDAFSISQSNPRDLYWTAAQMVAHHTSNGCNLQAGDLLATGTISGPERAAAGCLLELTRNGVEPIRLPNGETRAWLQDGDEVILRARCEREGVAPIQLGECTGRIHSARLSKRGSQSGL